ncbi:MAG: hypothetical protein WA610_06405 [Thermodesulfovibrionales bacterium]
MMSLKWLLVFVLFPTLAFASENCATQYGGVCRDVCEPEEESAEGAFIDCTEKQECCVVKAVPRKKGLMGGDAANGDSKKKEGQKQ